MGKYLRNQFQGSMFALEHDSAEDFYLSCWQKNHSPVPLLCLRAVIFLACVAIVLGSFSLTAMAMNAGLWFIFMTHWGLLTITIASGFSFAMSLSAYLKGPIESLFQLPWYVKVLWASYDIAVCTAFFITIYYYALLAGAYEEIDFAVNPVLDFFIHGMNSILMFVLLMTSRYPARLLHFIYPVGFGIFYLFFTLIYYFAGGVDPFGNRFIYPTLDWSNPGVTAIMVVVTAVVLILVHLVVVGLSACRNWLARRLFADSKGIPIQVSDMAYS